MNLVLVSFVPTTGPYSLLVGQANGVYVEGGDASGPSVVERVQRLATGAVHDPDGTHDAPRAPQEVWWDLLFVGPHPFHVQYQNMLQVAGKHGTLTAALRGLLPASPTIYTATARMYTPTGEWRPPYQAAKPNQLAVRVRFQLKKFWEIAP